MREFNAINQAFTLIEVMVAAVMIAILAATSIEFYGTYIKRTETQEVYMLLPKIANGEVVYYQKNGNFIDVGPVNIPPSAQRVTGDFTINNWPNIDFYTSSQILFGYRGYTSGSNFVCEAQGDQNGDGNTSIFTMNIIPKSKDEVTRGGVVYFDELE